VKAAGFHIYLTTAVAWPFSLFFPAAPQIPKQSTINMALISELLQSPYFLQGIAVSLLLVVVSNFYRELVDGFPYRNIPLVGRSRWEITNSKAKERFVASAKDLFAQGFSQV
jgi:hypothetical protein